MISNNDTSFLHNLLLIDGQVSSLPKTFANKLTAKTKPSKTQLSKMLQSSVFFGKILILLKKVGLSPMKNILIP